MKITILVEGKTERAFKPYLIEYLKPRLLRMPRLEMFTYDGRIPKRDDLRRKIDKLLSGREPSDAVIALTDVYTGTSDFIDAADAKTKMRGWVGNNPAFHPHAAQHDFEAWLLPYWSEIKKVAGHNRNAPQGPPEQVNHNRPPSHHVKEIFRIGASGRDYSKTRDAGRILRNQDLGIAAAQCPELRAFINTILTLSGGQAI